MRQSTVIISKIVPGKLQTNQKRIAKWREAIELENRRQSEVHPRPAAV